MNTERPYFQQDRGGSKGGDSGAGGDGESADGGRQSVLGVVIGRLMKDAWEEAVRMTRAQLRPGGGAKDNTTRDH